MFLLAFSPASWERGLVLLYMQTDYFVRTRNYANKAEYYILEVQWSTFYCRCRTVPCSLRKKNQPLPQDDRSEESEVSRFISSEKFWACSFCHAWAATLKGVQNKTDTSGQSEKIQNKNENRLNVVTLQVFYVCDELCKNKNKLALS